ncbi:outer membrane protein assembly factor BamB family protein, partial [Streptomyces sp. NPDC002920]
AGLDGAVLTVTGLDNAPHRASSKDELPPPDAADPAGEFLVVDPADGTVRRLGSRTSYATFAGTLDGQLVFLDADLDAIEVSGEVTYTRIVRLDPGTGDQKVTDLSAQKYGGTATLAHGTLYFVASGGLVTATSPLTGKRLWQRRTTLERPGGLAADGEGRTVFVATGSGRVAALDAAKGTLLWESAPRSDGLISVEPATVLLNRGALVVATSNSTVFSLDPAHPDAETVSSG